MESTKDQERFLETQHENPWFNSPLAHEAVTTVCEMMKVWLEEQMTPAMGVIRTWNDELWHYAVPGHVLEDWRTKNQLAAKLVRELFEKQGRWMIFASDTWMAKVTPDIDQSKMPKSLEDWPDDMRTEVLMLSCNAIGEQGFFVSVPYHREAGKIVWDAVDWESASKTVSHGRFLFDLRTRRVKDALKQAYDADREGRRKVTVH